MGMVGFRPPPNHENLKDPEVLTTVASLQNFPENYAPHLIIKTVSLVNVVKKAWKALNNDDPA